MEQDRPTSGPEEEQRTQSYKGEIIQRLFEKRWDAGTRHLANSIVLSGEITQEHAAYRRRRGQDVETTNPYAFMKDLLRSRKRNQIWPRAVFQAGFTARQVTGEGRVFEFVPIQENQTQPFPEVLPSPPTGSPIYDIPSVGLPMASRRLGRSDEPWLVQVSVRLHVIEAYFALFSTKRSTIRQVDHLQNGLKLRRTEIDALFLGIEEPSPGRFEEFLITCEAKTVGQDIIVEQVLQQAVAVFKLGNVAQSFVIPIAIKAISASRIHLVEFSAVKRAEAEEIQTITIANQAVFNLVPPVPGIGLRAGARAAPEQNNSISESPKGDNPKGSDAPKG